MSRSFHAAVLSHIESDHVHPVLMVKIEFTTPVYAHTGLGTIPFEGNDYLGVGNFGGVGGLAETENLIPGPVKMSLSALETAHFNEAMNAANYGDKVTAYMAYRNDDGSLIGTPWVFYKGRIEFSGVVKGSEDNSVDITLQHVLAILGDKIGSRYTDEDQQRKYPGDLGFQFVEKMEGLKLTWGSRDPGSYTGGGGGGGRRGFTTHER